MEPLIDTELFKDHIKAKIINIFQSVLFIEFSTMHKTTDNKRKQNANVVVLLDIVLALDYGRVRDTGSWYRVLMLSPC